MTATGPSRSGDGAASSSKPGLVESIARISRRTACHAAGFIAILTRAPRASPGRILLWPSRSLLLVGLLISIAVIAAAMRYLDVWAIDEVRHVPLRVLETFDQITDLGLSGWFLYPTAVLVIAIAALARTALGRITNLVLVSIVLRLLFVFFAIGAPGLVFTILKRIIGRVRPSALGPFAYIPFSWQSEYASFPSGHSATAFSAAVALGLLFPRARLALWVYAVTIALSRVVITVHYPSDVIAGALVGGFGALAVRNWFAVRRLAFTTMADGKPVALPGPSLRRIKAVARKLIGA
jgi:membrane-associated phospholipid phosphatase